jgi:hypothetical protein
MQLRARDSVVFQFNGRTAVDDELGLEIAHDHKWRDDGPWIAVIDRVGGASFAFPLVTETRVIDHPKWSRQPWPAPVAHRISRPSLGPYLSRIAEARRRRGSTVSDAEVIEAFRQGMFAYATRGGKVLEWAPDFEVTWVDDRCAVSDEPIS